MELLPENIRLEAELATLGLLPSKSEELYNKEYSLFKTWRTENLITENSENIFLAYFLQKSRKYKSSSLWAQYSMLKATLNLYENLDIGKYRKLTAFLKKRHVGYEAKKSSVFSREELEKFLSAAPDETFLLIKVATVFAVAGGCRCDELIKMCIEDVQDKDDLLLVHIPYTKTHKKRSFTMLANGFGINPVDLYRKYLSLRPKKVATRRLFLSYRRGICTVQPVGINTFGKMPTNIAKFLNLEDASTYTGHSFRRSAATLLADCGADITTLKRFGGWKSDNVAEGYVEDSLQNKVKIGKKILGDNNNGASTASTNYEMKIVEKQNENSNVSFGNAIQFHNNNCTINVNIYKPNTKENK